MRRRRFTFLLIFFAISVSAMVSSCQKDPAEVEPAVSKIDLKADSIVSSPGNFLAASGTLKIKFNDSTYTFDAAHDSIAFINVHIDSSNTHFFGITAINKEHSMSFGISSSGSAYNNINKSIAGGQFLLSTDAQKPAVQLSLSKYSGQKDFGNINIVKYNIGNVLAKGTFYTFLAKDDKANSPFYRVEGTFDLQLK
jgi:hypothetical protein